MTILDQLAQHAKIRMEEAKKVKPLEEIKEEAFALMAGAGGLGAVNKSPDSQTASGTGTVSNRVACQSAGGVGLPTPLASDFPFEAALKKNEIAFICECKKASPSKGLIADDFPYLQIAKEYEEAGADCISVLTEPKWFLGSNQYLSQISEAVSVPCLRKDFTVDEYMIYEAKVLGASAVLLICSILDKERMHRYIQICDSLGLSALVEAHNEDEVKRAIDVGARIIGVNNRNLKDFSVDTKNSEKLRSLVPNDIIFVAESGINSADDVAKLRKIGVDAILVGESLMRAADKKAKLAELKGVPNGSKN